MYTHIYPIYIYIYMFFLCKSRCHEVSCSHGGRHAEQRAPEIRDLRAEAAQLSPGEATASERRWGLVVLPQARGGAGGPVQLAVCFKGSPGIIPVVPPEIGTGVNLWAPLCPLLWESPGQGERG